MKTVESESREYPLALDASTSSSTVYVRKDIQEIDKDGEVFYKYTEEQWPREDWEKTNIPEINKKIDLLMMMMLESEGIL